MIQIDEQQIGTYAPNPAAAANGKKISQHGDFVRLECSGDDQFYLGECKGSGKSNYITTIDFVDPAQPVFRCSCPSRQFPCKHSLGLLYEIMAQKQFSPCEVPEEILQKRAKKQARTEKSETASGAAKQKKTELSESSKSARAKKIKKQLEGLDLTAQLITDLLSAGLGAMGGTSLASYRQLSKRLGDYYLPGPQWHLRQLLDRTRPKLVLVEGPSDFTAQLPHLLSPETKPPIAILAYTDAPPIHTILYPFAEYSPEYQAILWAHENEAECRFFDLPSDVFLALSDARKAAAAEDESPSPNVYERLDRYAGGDGHEAM